MQTFEGEKAAGYGPKNTELAVIRPGTSSVTLDMTSASLASGTASAKLNQIFCLSLSTL